MSNLFIERYTERQRMNHWVMAITLILAAFSGLAFFHPSLFFMSAFFGGPGWTRILHPFLGVVAVVSFLGLASTLWRDNVLNDGDREWNKHMGDMLRGNKAGLPPVGKYNGGQKMVFWVMALSAVVLLVTGIAFWHPWFTPSFPIGVQRVAVLLHAVAAVALLLATIVHVYAAVWVKGTVRAMTRGNVSEDWARLNHPLWHQEMTRGK